MQKALDWLFRLSACRFGFHDFSPYELSWPADRTEIQFHCSHCQKVIETVELV